MLRSASQKRSTRRRRPATTLAGARRCFVSELNAIRRMRVLLGLHGRHRCGCRHHPRPAVPLFQQQHQSIGRTHQFSAVPQLTPRGPICTRSPTVAASRLHSTRGCDAMSRSTTNSVASSGRGLTAPWPSNCRAKNSALESCRCGRCDRGARWRHAARRPRSAGNGRHLHGGPRAHDRADRGAPTPR